MKLTRSTEQRALFALFQAGVLLGLFDSEGGDMIPRNIGLPSPDYTVLHLRREKSLKILTCVGKSVRTSPLAWFKSVLKSKCSKDGALEARNMPVMSELSIVIGFFKHDGSETECSCLQVRVIEATLTGPTERESPPPLNLTSKRHF
jgi:hypothetical protein